MAKKTLTELAVMAVTEVREKIKKMTEKNVKFHDEVKLVDNIDAKILDEAASLKAKMDIVEAELNSLKAQYDPLRKEILAFLPGAPEDKVEAIVNGVLIKKFSQVKGAGKLDHNKMLEVVKAKKLLSKTTTQVRVINEDAIIEAVAAGHITLDEYKQCLTKGTTSQVLKLERKFYPVKSEEEEIVDLVSSAISSILS